jgi:hypothetical protein
MSRGILRDAQSHQSALPEPFADRVAGLRCFQGSSASNCPLIIPCRNEFVLEESTTLPAIGTPILALTSLKGLLLNRLKLSSYHHCCPNPRTWPRVVKMN